MLSARTAAFIAVAIGVALEVGVSMVTGRREAWDAGVYWTVGLPLAAIGAAVIGYLSIGRAWSSAWLIIPAQVATMILRNTSGGGLWPLAVMLSSVMGLPFVGVAWIARRARS